MPRKCTSTAMCSGSMANIERAGMTLTYLTCLSCRHYRLQSCALNVAGYPRHTCVTCRHFDYEPGVDEGQHEKETN